MQEGPWSVVNKYRHPRKNWENDLTMVQSGLMNVLVVGENSMGSRFSILGKYFSNLEVDILEEDQII